MRTIGDVRIGLFGMGISPDNLITPRKFQGVKYLDPVQMSRGVVRLLREQEKCQLVVGMSHLGYYANPSHGEIGDTQVAAQVSGIDFIASGHTHTFMEKPVLQKNPEGKDTIIFQVGKSGIYVGRIDFKLKDGKVVASAGKIVGFAGRVAGVVCWSAGALSDRFDLFHSKLIHMIRRESAELSWHAI